MNLLTVVMFGALLVLSMNPNKKSETADQSIVEQAQQNITEKGVENVVANAIGSLRSKHTN